MYSSRSAAGNFCISLVPLEIRLAGFHLINDRLGFMIRVPGIGDLA